ncbi:MAG: ribosome biogenesis GTP-binding protein YihA/YsxC [Verrucomicrobia bacterium]|nr:ribosome biogenesis GTP-binding protein YihA/YsxC [Verrucomicrobiota bacterium]MDA1005967.1 ribosome biogenesis GTP-binding protein YihA/YsxC [Verrucomicrobiota bacterium]
MRITSATFLTSAPDLESCPEPTVPEFAFIGRSNVGKSSLLNMLSGKKDLAKVSGSPGHTRLINYFTMNENWRLVDLPGYGYAKTSKKDREKFQGMISEYLTERVGLSCVFVLIDARHTPQQIDLEFVQWLMEAEVQFVLVFTKTDKLKNSKVEKHMEAFGLAMGPWCEVLPRMFKSSAEKGDGRKDILEFVGKALG